MSIIPGVVFSRPRWIPIRVRTNPMDREVYLDNDHLIDYYLGERTTGKFITGQQLTAYLSLNPTGSAIVSTWYGGPTSSLVSVTQFTSSVTSHVSESINVSILYEFSQSLTTVFSGSNIGTVMLSASLIETPAGSGEYIGTIPGPDITTALSSSFTQSFSSSFSETITTGSLSASFSASVTTSLSITMSVSGFTSSFTASQEVPRVETANRAFGIYEIISSGSFLRASTPMTLRSVRFLL